MTFASRDQLGVYASSDGAERRFCRSCGTTLFYFLKPTPDVSREDRKPPGYAYADDHERRTEAETFERLT